MALAILSNTDPDLLEASIRAIGVSIDETVVASDIGSYKPAFGHWETFFRRTSAERARHVHVAASLFHDIEPCAKLGLPAIWIDRLVRAARCLVRRRCPTSRSCLGRSTASCPPDRAVSGTDERPCRRTAYTRAMDAVARAIASGDDLYALLGVDPGASDEDIRHAHRALARRYHPDANSGDGRPDGFRRIAAAYEVLGHERERAAYDRARRSSPRCGARRPSRADGGTPRRAPPESPAREVAPHRRTRPIHPSRSTLALSPTARRRVAARPSLLGRVVAAAAALMVIALVALVVVSANAREPEPPSTHDVVQDP